MVFCSSVINKRGRCQSTQDTERHTTSRGSGTQHISRHGIQHVKSLEKEPDGFEKN